MSDEVGTPWYNDPAWDGTLQPDDLMATYTFSDCGCKVEVRFKDLPLSALVCAHGNYWSSVGPELGGNVIIGSDQ